MYRFRGRYWRWQQALRGWRRARRAWLQRMGSRSERFEEEGSSRSQARSASGESVADYDADMPERMTGRSVRVRAKMADFDVDVATEDDVVAPEVVAPEMEEGMEGEEAGEAAPAAPASEPAAPAARQEGATVRGAPRNRKEMLFEAFAKISGQKDAHLSDGRPRVESVNEQLEARGEEQRATREEIDAAFEEWQRRNEGPDNQD